jgi:hypothetical protein
MKEAQSSDDEDSILLKARTFTPVWAVNEENGEED